MSAEVPILARDFCSFQLLQGRLHLRRVIRRLDFKLSHDCAGSNQQEPNPRRAMLQCDPDAIQDCRLSAPCKGMAVQEENHSLLNPLCCCCCPMLIYKGGTRSLCMSTGGTDPRPSGYFWAAAHTLTPRKSFRHPRLRPDQSRQWKHGRKFHDLAELEVQKISWLSARRSLNTCLQRLQ